MKEQLDNFFKLNKQERNGAFLLLIIATVFNLWLMYRPTSEKLEISYTVLEESRTIKEEKNSEPQAQNKTKYNNKKTYKKKATVKDQQSTLKKESYESKWNDYPKNEYKKDTFYENTYKSKFPKKKNEPIDINIATAEQWETLSGIGPVLSKRIVKFRDGMGGFYKIDQVSETWGLSPETFENIRPLLVYSTPQKRVSINSLDVEGLLKFRFISPKEAEVVMRYREQHGPFNNISDLKKVVVLEDDQLAKLEPYLSFD